MNAFDLGKLLAEIEDSKRLVRFAKIDPAYIDGKPALVFDGESNATIKRYPYLSSYTPVADERVMVMHGVVIGSIVS